MRKKVELGDRKPRDGCRTRHLFINYLLAISIAALHGFDGGLARGERKMLGDQGEEEQGVKRTKPPNLLLNPRIGILSPSVILPF